MFARDRAVLRPLPIVALALIAWLAPAPATRGAETVTIGDLTFVNQALVGVGRLPSDLRDKFGETFGSGSAIAVDPKSWLRTAAGYQGTFYMLPDRGYNVTGTSDYRARINKLFITFKPLDDPMAIPVGERQTSVEATLTDTILLTDAAGQSLTGLDPDGIRRAANGLPDLPQASNGHVSIDSESLALLPDGSFFIGDEYGPYVYRFAPTGRLLAAIRPPEAFLPKRKGKDQFSSNNPGPGAKAPEPANPDTGRQNNQGFEGLTLTPGGKFLVVALQSATRQDGGASPQTRRYSRLLYYDISDLERPKLAREHLVPLPVFETADGQQRVAAQSELLALDETFFLLLCRDANNGFGTDSATSRYRSIDLLDTSWATNIAGSRYDGTVPVAPNGKLVDGVVPATLTPYIDINETAELQKFGLHNGEPNDRNNLSEKWEGMALVPALDPANPNDYFLFVTNDNDFITQNGYQAGTAYKDPSGLEIDTMILVYRITLPQLLK
ncbi:MAG: hypothetical protein AUI16_12385 [Alphaproteobacteria bacterium 13_2_20CM_2_64_7]|jgi:hypothetical protein|nr:MAG: hypothetical protein AUI16_12385 [Alphaproteobacteria bacterium 13_2_20CM_2_64_7]